MNSESPPSAEPGAAEAPPAVRPADPSPRRRAVNILIALAFAAAALLIPRERSEEPDLPPADLSAAFRALLMSGPAGREEAVALLQATPAGGTRDLLLAVVPGVAEPWRAEVAALPGDDVESQPAGTPRILEPAGRTVLRQPEIVLAGPPGVVHTVRILGPGGAVLGSVAVSPGLPALLPGEAALDDDAPRRLLLLAPGGGAVLHEREVARLSGPERELLDREIQAATLHIPVTARQPGNILARRYAQAVVYQKHGLWREARDVLAALARQGTATEEVLERLVFLSLRLARHEERRTYAARLQALRAR